LDSFFADIDKKTAPKKKKAKKAKKSE